MIFKKGKILKKRTKVFLILGIIIDALVCICLFILYGPWNVFRDFWITSAMTTMNHKYLAHWFYSDETIAEVMANNTVIDNGEDTNVDLIDKDSTTATDKYDKQILTRDKGNNSYKLIEVSGSTYKGFLVVIYDPSKIELATSKYFKSMGEKLDAIAEANKAIVAINASGFMDPDGNGNGGTPTGSVVKDGKLIYSSTPPISSGGVIGFDKNNNLVLSKESMSTALTKYKLRDAVQFGPFLIVNGKSSYIKGNGGWGNAARTVIGQRKDGIVLLLIIDGRQPGYSIGADMVELANVMTNYKAINAANLDGGSSTGLVINYKLINKPCGPSGLRYLPDAWIVKK